MKLGMIGVVLAAVLACAASAKDEAKVVTAELFLPRFTNFGANEFRAHPGLREAIESVPSVKARDFLFGISFQKGKERIKGFPTIIKFDPAKADVGDIAKAIDKLPVSEELRKRPAAVLFIRVKQDPDLKKETVAKITEALAKVKGIDLERSRGLVFASIMGVVLSESGEAKLGEIRGAVEALGLKIQDH